VEFLTRAFLPLLARMGVKVELMLERHGFYPRGGGVIEARITPAARLKPIALTERGARSRGYAEAFISAVPTHVASRELAVVGERMNWMPEQLLLRGLQPEVGPGNVLVVTLEHEHVTEVFTGFGERGRSAESVADSVAREAREYLAHRAPVGEHLADQLLLPMAFGGLSSFVTIAVTPHFESNAEVIRAFTGKRVSVEQNESSYTVTMS
jgi:RNA 3'-terminal phosphate cyclase (ATP)